MGALAKLPQLLYNRLIEETCMRLAVEEQRRILSDLEDLVRRLDRGRFPLGRALRKLAKRADQDEVARAKAAVVEARNAARRVETLVNRLVEEVETLVDVYLADQTEGYASYRSSLRGAQAWTQAIQRFEEKLGELIDLLAREDGGAKAAAPSRRHLVFDAGSPIPGRLADAVKAAARQTVAVNEAARRIGHMPEIRLAIGPEDLNLLGQMDAAERQAEQARLAALLGAWRDNQIEELKRRVAAELELRQEQADAYLATYLEQIRAHVAAEGVAAGADLAAVRERVEARYAVA